MRKTYMTLLLVAGMISAVTPSNAQPSSDPNLRNFYMARQQITITDDGPLINDQRTVPQPGAAGGGPGAGGMPGLPVGLPRAGWQPYSSQIPSVRTALPKVNNGVPPKMPPATPGGLSGKAGALKAKPGAVAKPAAPAGVQSYQAYKGYGGNLTPSTSSGSGSGGAAGYSSTSNVQGSVLHWARKKKGY